MRHRTVATILSLGIVALVAAPASANLPDLNLSSATVDAAAATLFSIPDGSGQPLTAAQDATGSTVDATITVNILNPLGNPLVGFPLEDIWLESLDGALLLCGTVYADADTDANGDTAFTGSIAAGGNTIVANGGGLKVMVLGQSLIGSDIALNVLTPDLNGDYAVTLTDLILFANAFNGAYDPAADFYFDGEVNLSDLIEFANGMDSSCVR